MDSDEGDATGGGPSAGDGDGLGRGRTLADGGEETASLDGRFTDDRPSRGGPYDVWLAWAEHRTYVLFAAGLLVVGMLVGIAMAAADVDLLDLLVDLGAIESSDPEALYGDVEFTTSWFLVNNTVAFLFMVFGAASLGLLTALGLLFNGVLIGWVGAVSAGQDGVGYVLVLLVPHGVFELPALAVAAGVGFRLVHLAVNYVRGVRDRFLYGAELRRTLTLLVVAWIALAVAAVIEVHVTPAIADAIFGGIEQEPAV